MLPFSFPGFEVQEVSCAENVFTITAQATAPTAHCPTTLGKQEALVLAGEKRVLMTIEASPDEHDLITTNPVERAGMNLSATPSPQRNGTGTALPHEALTAALDDDKTLGVVMKRDAAPSRHLNTGGRHGHTQSA